MDLKVRRFTPPSLATGMAPWGSGRRWGVISHDAHAAVLGTQDGECLEQAAEGIAGESQAGGTSHLDGREPGGGEFGV